MCSPCPPAAETCCGTPSTSPPDPSRPARRKKCRGRGKKKSGTVLDRGGWIRWIHTSHRSSTDRSYRSYLTCRFDILCMICTLQIPLRKTVLDHAGYTSPTWQHQLLQIIQIRDAYTVEHLEQVMKHESRIRPEVWHESA